MAHELTILNGKASMAYVDATPWHGLGQRLTEGAPFEIWLKESGLNFSVLRSPAQYSTPDGILTHDDTHILYRSDSHDVLGVVSSKYKVVQPEEVLHFYQDLCDQYGFELETAGTLLGGKKLWALARTPMNLVLRGGDEINGYMLLATSNDGSLATIAKFTSIRVVCQNTLNVSLDNNAHTIKVSHKSVFNPDRVKHDIGIIRSDWDYMSDVFRELTNRKVTPQEAGQFIFDVMKVDDNSKKMEDESTRSQNIMQEVFQSVISSPGSGILSAEGTAWGLLNGVTHFVDHKGGARTADNRLVNAWFGKGEEIKTKAFQTALKLVA